MGKKIAGIHHYCDRWCERCAFTSACTVYASEQGLGDAEKDVRNEAFWKRLSENFAKAFEVLHAKAKKMGLDPDALVSSEEEHRQKHAREQLLQQEHPLSLISLRYGTAARQWMKAPAIDKKADQIARAYEMGLASEAESIEKATGIKDCLQIIGWYESLIPAKLLRAISGKTYDTGWEKENGLQPDFEGSAKVALIGIDRSMQAWLRLYTYMPDEQDNILTFLAMLEKMKKMTMDEFPGAPGFVRPGFDG